MSRTDAITLCCICLLGYVKSVILTWEFSTLTLAEEMRNLHLGQSYDLHWSHHSQKPTPEEYFNMVDGSKYLFGLSSLSIQLVDNW